MEKKEILNFNNVSFRREGRVILKNINWTVHSDENWALLGLNGSGKSTLLSMIPAYTFPTTGELRVFNKAFGNCIWKEVKNRIGFVSSSLNIFLDKLNNFKLKDIVLSGKFNSIGIYQEVTDEDKAWANEIIEDFKISYIKENKFSTLSQGEQRKTLLARAFMNKPDFLILDEPCSGLDIKSREKFLSSLEEYSKGDSRIPFIYVSHQIEEIIPSITHVAILDNGELIAKGKKEEVLKEDLLSKIYDTNVKIEWENARPWLIIR